SCKQVVAGSIPVSSSPGLGRGIVDDDVAAQAVLLSPGGVRGAALGSERLVPRPVQRAPLAGHGVPAGHAIGAAGAGHVALDGAVVVLEGGGGVAEERAATGGGRLAVGHRDREGPVLAVLEARLREVPVHDRAGRGVLLEDAGDVP